MSGSFCPRCGKALPTARLEGMCDVCSRLVAPLVCMVAASCSDSPAGAATLSSVRSSPPALQVAPVPQTREADSGEDPWGLNALLDPPQRPDELGWLGSYRVLKVLGVGGMGIVFEAEDRILGRNVALKGMLPAVASKIHSRQRFLHEARATAGIQHENIVTVHHVAEHRGIPFMVMELLQGETLEQRLRREQRLSIEEVVRIGLQIARGLAAAHEQDLVHRDIKPSNIWLEAPDSRVRILDFGLARQITEDSSLTLSGVILGTPAYMAPEQARGLPVDCRTDLFSLGAVLYRACTGEVPFRGQDPLSVLTALAVEPPRPIHELNAEAPPALNNLIMRLLEKAPGDRPSSAQVTAQDLEAVQRDLSVSEILGIDEPSLRLDDAAIHTTLLSMPDPTQENARVPHPASVVSEARLPVLPLDRLHELAGHTLGHHDLIEVLGRGHVGVVFRAVDRDSGRVVALKVLSPTFPHEPREVERFTRAIRAMPTDEHPHLVRLHSAGKFGPYFWIAQEFVPGKSLGDALQQAGPGKRFDWQLAFRVALHVSRALVIIGRHRIVHGNITPHNILMCSDDGSIKLNDVTFRKALRKSVLARSVREQKMRQELACLAPEQASGDGAFIDHVCDVYSLGAVLYLLVTGVPPFMGRTLQEQLADLREGVVSRPRKYQKAIPRPFEAILLRMLARRQEDRYQSAAALLGELTSFSQQHQLVE